MYVSASESRVLARIVGLLSEDLSERDVREAVGHHLQQQRVVEILGRPAALENRDVTGIGRWPEFAIQMLGRECKAQPAGIGAVVAALAVQNDS